MASYRARESERPDALFRDPLAARLAGDKGPAIAAAMSGSRYTAWSVVIRTCIIDDYLRELAAAGLDAVVNLGAGLDTRPYRLELPSTLRWIEVDYPHLIARKEALLAGQAPRCRLERVPLDLAKRAERRELFQRLAAEAPRLVVLTEGVLPYLTSEDVAALAQDVRVDLRARHWIVDYFSPAIGRFLHKRRRRQQMRNAPFQFVPGDWHGFFAAQGWRPRTTRYFAETSRRLGRRIPRPWWAVLITAITPAKHRAEMGRSLAYVLLEPTPGASTDAP